MAKLKTSRVKEAKYTKSGRPIYPEYQTRMNGRVFYIGKHEYMSRVMWVEIDAETGEEFNQSETKTDVVDSIYYREKKCLI